MSVNPNQKAAEWIEKHWTAWQKNGGVFGPLTTFTAGFGLLTYALTTGQHSKAVVFISTSIGAGIGLLSAELIGDVVSGNGPVGGILQEYGQVLVTYPVMSIIWVASSGLIGTALFQIFGGEILDFIPGVDAVALGIQMAVSLGVGIVSLPVASSYFKLLEEEWSHVSKTGHMSWWDLFKATPLYAAGKELTKWFS